MAEEKIHNVDVRLRYAVTGNKSTAEKELAKFCHRNTGLVKPERLGDGRTYDAKLLTVDVSPDACEGYVNYLTFSVAVWLKNDRKLYDQCRAVALAVISDEEVASRAQEEDERGSELVMADWLQQFVEILLQVDWREETANTDADRMFVQMAQAALGQVDWRELSEEWILDVQED